jgi:DNA-binding NarL/FixJ family response regulator
MRRRFGASAGMLHRLRAAEARRNREIMRHARLGWTNAEIGAQFGLHEKHVSRIVSAAIRQGWYRP